MLYANSPQQLEYFDSLGNGPLEELEYYMNSFDVWRRNRLRVQSPLSALCGVHCLYVAFLRSRGVDFESVMQTYDDESPSTNDSEVAQFYKERFGSVHPHIDRSGVSSIVQTCRCCPHLCL